MIRESQKEHLVIWTNQVKEMDILTFSRVPVIGTVLNSAEGAMGELWKLSL